MRTPISIITLVIGIVGVITLGFMGFAEGLARFIVYGFGFYSPLMIIWAIKSLRRRHEQIKV